MILHATFTLAEYAAGSLQNSVYMNGATAEYWANATSTPISSKVAITGASQNFLRSRMKAHKSFTRSSIERSPLGLFRVKATRCSEESLSISGFSRSRERLAYDLLHLGVNHLTQSFIENLSD